MATYQELRTRSQQVRDEQNIGGNTALRVGQLLMDIVKYFYDNDAAASEYLQQHFAMVNDGTQLLNWQQSPIVILHTMGETYDDGDWSALSHGENYYRAGFIMEADGQGGGINGETPKANVLYVNLANDTLYTWNGSSFDAITNGGGGGSISGDDIIKNAYYSNGNLVLIIETESGDKTVTIPVTFDASNYVPTSRTVNGKALSSNITLSQSDIPGLVAALAAKVGYSDDEWLQVKAGAMQAATAVPNTTTVNGKQLNDNITIQMADIPGLGTAIGEAGKVKTVSVNNGTPAQPDSNGNVNIQVQTGSTISPADTAPQMDGTAAVGSSAKYAREDHVHPHDTTKANASDVYLKSQTYSKGEVDAMLDDIEAGDTIVVNSDGANIVDEHDNNSVLFAPSARQMKLMYENVMAIYNGLANTAFTNGKPTLDWVGEKTKYTLSYGTLTGCTADVAAGQVNEGALRIKLTPTQASYAFTSVTVNGEIVATTATGDADGSVYLNIVVNRDITVGATATSGYGVSLAGSGHHLTLIGTSVTAGGNYSGTINPDPHYDRPQSITATMNNVNVDFNASGNSYDPSTGAIAIANVTGNIVITASATPQASINVTFNVTGAVITHGSETLGGSVTVYSGDKPYSITIQPESGKSWSSTPTATGGTLTHSGEVYTLVINAADTSDIVVAGSAREAGNLTINLPLNTAHVVLKASDNSTPISTNPTVSDSGSEGWTGYISAEETSGTVDYYNTYDSYDLTEVKVMMGNNDITSSVFNPSTGKIEIAAVTDNVTVTAKVMTFHEGRGIYQSSGNLTPVNAPSVAIDKYCFCATDFIDIPSGTASVVVDLGEDGAVSPAVYMGFYNSEYGFISSEGITGSPNMPKLNRYKKIAVPSGAAYLRTTIYTDQNVTYNGDEIESIERVNSVRKSRYVLAIDSGGNKSYLYKGIDYDGRYEDVYPLTFGDVIKCKIATETILDTPTNSDVSSGMMTGLIEIPDGCTALRVRLGVLDYYTKYYANIAYYDANQAKLSNYFIVSGDVEETATPPSGAAYIRISTNKPDTSYVVVVGGDSAGDYLFKGILVE